VTDGGGLVQVAGAGVQFQPDEVRQRGTPRFAVPGELPVGPLEQREGLGGIAAADGLDGEQGVRQCGAELLVEAGEQLAALRGRGGAVGVGVDDAGAGPAGDGQRLQRARPRRR
jgi:hypothetical protein